MAHHWVRNGEDDRRLMEFLESRQLSRRGFTKLVGGTAAAALGVSAVGSRSEAQEASPQPGTGGTFRPQLLSDPSTLDPIAAGATDVFERVIEPLAELNLNNEIEGVLAESWDISDDGLEYTFHLRKGITFHDGTPFNADAVKFFFDRIIDPSVTVPFRSWVGPLQETQVIDDYTAKVIFSEPFSPFLGNIAISWFSLPSPTSYTTYGDAIGDHPVGTGPFIYADDKRVRGESLTLIPNPNYKNNPRSWVHNKGVPLVEAVEYRIIADPATATAAFESGEIHELRDINKRDFTRFKDDSNYQTFIQKGGTNVLYIEFSMLTLPEGQEYGATWKAPFDDIRVRQAVGYGIDIDTIMASMTYGLAERNYGPMPTGLWAYKPEIEQYGFHFDADKAKSLLDEAGWVDSDGDGIREKDGTQLKVLFWSTTFDDRDQVAQVVQNYLNQIGFSCEVQVPDAGVYSAGLTNNVCDMSFQSFSVPEPDVLRLITNYDHGIGRYKDKEFQDYVADAMKTVDHAKRTELYFNASKKMLADAAMIPFWTPLEYATVPNTVHDYHCALTYNHGIYSDVWVED